MLEDDRDESAQKLKAAIGLAVCRQRVVEGMTQAELAAASGLSESYISRLERGLANPRLMTLDALAESLNVGVMTLFWQAGL